MSIETRHRVGLVGAGGICSHHVAALRRLVNVEIVGVTDLDPTRAQQLAGELEIAAHPSLKALVDAGAEVIHVLTPPHSHAEVALEAIERGCHVLVEKPFADDPADCRRVQEAASARGRVVSVDHSLLFDPLVAQAIADVRAHKIGRVVSVDILRGSVYPPYAGGPLPPQYREAGYPFRDLGVHGLYLFEAFLGPIQDVTARWRSFGGDRNLSFDEWRALVQCEHGIGQLQLSWNTKPIQHQIIIHGTHGVLRLDLFAMFRTLRRTYPLPKAAERLLGGVSDAVEPLIHMSANVARVAAGIIRPYQGLHNMVGAFYRHLDGLAPAPVDLNAATEVVRWTEEVARAADDDVQQRLSLAPPAPHTRYLVTGASGAVGSAIVARLLERGSSVRAFVRRPPEEIPEGLEVVVGDLGDPEAVRRAVKGVSIVIHAGAAMAGGWEQHRVATVEGTRNVLDACAAEGCKLVHISSMSVVRYAAGEEGEPISESTPFEPEPEARGAYTRAKLEAEKLVQRYVEERKLGAIILRPGQIFGGRIPLMTPAVARKLAADRWLVLGDGEVSLPLVYLDDVVDAVLLAADGEHEAGEVVQLTDEALTQNEVLERVAHDAKVVHFPRPLLFALGKLSEPVFAALGRRSPVSSYRLRSALAKKRFVPNNVELLGWHPRVGVEGGIARTRTMEDAA